VRFGFEDYFNLHGRNIGVPRIEVILEKGGIQVNERATIDSGAEVCLFDQSVAEALGIEIADGERIPLTGIGGHDVAYAHIVTLTFFDGVATHSFPCRVLFNEHVRQNLIGREDFFEVFRVTFSKHKGYIELNQVYDLYENR
jgi:hypothetical protein